MHDYNEELYHSQAVNDLAAILARGVVRHIRLSQADALNPDNQASKNELLFSSGHGSLSRELTDKSLERRM